MFDIDKHFQEIYCTLQFMCIRVERFSMKKNICKSENIENETIFRYCFRHINIYTPTNNYISICTD